jgi:hypothetical protein
MMKVLAICVLGVLAGCANSSQRFVPYGEGGVYALDTHTGQKCFAIPKEQVPKEQLSDPGLPPFCYDLYKTSN